MSSASVQLDHAIPRERIAAVAARAGLVVVCALALVHDDAERRLLERRLAALPS